MSPVLTGLELRRARLALGLDRAELAQLAGLSTWCLKTLELNTRHGRDDTWRRIEAALRVVATGRGLVVEDVLEELAS